MKLDRFDIINISAAAVLAAGAVFYAVADGRVSHANAAVRSERKADPDALQKTIAAKAVMDSGQVKEAAESLKEICRANPADADAHALLGQACSRLQDYPAAVKEFRMCLSLDADFVDSKSPKFIGKRIKSTLKECKPQFELALSKNPDDKEAVAAVQDMHYLERMLAGGCE